MKYVPPLGQEAQGESAHFTDGNPELGILGSIVPAASIEQGQREIVNVIKSSGLEPNAEDLSQLCKAIVKLIGKNVPLATTEIAGLVKCGAGLNIDADGLLTIPQKESILAVSSTASGVAVKEFELEGFELRPGVKLDVLFSNVNSADSPHISINGGASKPLLWQGMPPEVGQLAKDQIYSLMYSGTSWQILGGLAPWSICQTVWWEDTLNRQGFLPMNGGTVDGFSVLYPQAAAYLNTAHGQARCFASLADRNAAHTAIYATFSTGATEGWAGLGGISKFFWDKAQDKLYLPDLVGMFRCMAGDGIVAPSMGGVMGDRIRELYGNFIEGREGYGSLGHYASGGVFCRGTGIFGPGALNRLTEGVASSILMEASRIVPTGPTNSPRSWGALACVYLGQQAC